MMLEKRHNKPEDTSEIESLFDFLCLLLSSFFDETKQDFSNLSKKKTALDTMQHRLYEINDDLLKLKYLIKEKTKTVERFSDILSVNFLKKNDKKNDFLGVVKNELEMTLRECADIQSTAESLTNTVDYIFSYIINSASFAKNVGAKTEKRYMKFSDILKNNVENVSENEVKSLSQKLKELKYEAQNIENVSKNIVLSSKSAFGIARISHAVCAEIFEISAFISQNINRHSNIFFNYEKKF